MTDEQGRCIEAANKIVDESSFGNFVYPGEEKGPGYTWQQVGDANSSRSKEKTSVWRVVEDLVSAEARELGLQGSGGDDAGGGLPQYAGSR